MLKPLIGGDDDLGKPRGPKNLKPTDEDLGTG